MSLPNVTQNQFKVSLPVILCKNCTITPPPALTLPILGTPQAPGNKPGLLPKKRYCLLGEASWSLKFWILPDSRKGREFIFSYEPRLPYYLPPPFSEGWGGFIPFPSALVQNEHQLDTSLNPLNSIFRDV